MNRYAYTANNPVKYKDPSGNDFEDGATGTRARSVNISTKTASSEPLLEWGSRGDSVVKAQKILDELGYYLGPSGVDGIYGKYTNEAVEAYQTRNGLQVDGKVGPETWGSFNSYVNKKAAESRDRSKNSKGCGGTDAISSAAMGTGNSNKIYTREEANKYINVKIWGGIETRKIYFSNEISNLPEEITYKKDGHIYSYMLQEQNEYFMEVTLRTNITIDGKNVGIKKYAYDLVYTDEPKVSMGVIFIGGLGAKGSGSTSKIINLDLESMEEIIHLII